jgi:diguanylate cyclase (GGDEF)-like protein/PAS domain S-box-containing protein
MVYEQGNYRVLLETSYYALAHHRLVMDRAGNPVDYIFLKVNRAFEEMTDLAGKKIIGRKVTEVLPGIEKSEFDWIGTYGKVAMTGGSIRFEQYSKPLQRWYEVIAYSEEKGFFTTVFLDITDRKKEEELLRNSEMRFRSLVGNMQCGIVVEDDKRNIILTNQGFCEIFSIPAPPEALIGSDCSKAAEEVKHLLADPELFPSRTTAIIEQRRTVIGEEIHFADGRVYERDYIPVFAENNNFIGHMWQYRDITERKKTEKALTHHSQLQKLLMELMADFINIPLEKLDDAINVALKELGEFVGADRVYVFDYDFKKGICTNTYEWCAPGISPQIENLKAVPLDIIPDWVGCHVRGEAMDIPDVPEMPPGAVKDILEPQEILSLLAIPMMAGTDCVGFVGFDAVKQKRDYSPEERKLLSIFARMLSNVSLRRKAEEIIRHTSFHDSLTGLYNRRYMEQEMKRLDTKRQLPLSIIMADLNGLKLVNDTYGHEKGDELLKKAAHILGKACREEDIVARWGGDEFVILLPQTTTENARLLCKRITGLCSKADVEDVPVSMALGVASKTDPKGDLKATLSDAEDNMYRDKLTARHSTKSETFKMLIKILEEKSCETEAHIQGMQNMARLIGNKINLSNTEFDRLNTLINLHDIGNINIDEEILTKEGPLTAEEWEAIKKHPETGSRIAGLEKEFASVADEILAHHEHWDGAGYPYGIKGKEIPLLARITAIADAFEVMQSGRPYKKALNKSEIIDELKRCSGTQFDPELIKALLPSADIKHPD